MFCQNKCIPGASVADKVRVDPEAIALEQARRDAEEAQRKEEEQQRADEEERKRLEELREEEERQRLVEEERRCQQEAEEAQRKQEEEEEAQRKQEAERRERERLEQEQRLKRKAALDEFYQRYGFDGVNQPRKGGACQVLKINVTYPLHQAAELGKEQIVEYLLQEGAQVNQMNSSKLTAAHVAKKKDKGGSHAEVLRLLRQAVQAPSGGAPQQKHRHIGTNTESNTPMVLFEPHPGDALEMQIRVNIANITDIDSVQQTFKARVFVTATIPGGASRPGLEDIVDEKYFKGLHIRNAIEEYSTDRKIDVVKEDLQLSWQVSGVFEETMELDNFPFDSQELNVHLRVNNANEDEFPVKLVFQQDASKIQTSLFLLHNTWHLLSGLAFQVTDSDSNLSGRGFTYPNIIIKAKVQRRPLYYVMNVCVPMFSFVCMAFTSFFVPSEDAGDRLALSLTLVLTAAAYKFVVAGMVPALGYLTMLDGFVMWCSFFIFAIVIENAVMSDERMEGYDGHAMAAVACLFCLTNLYYVLHVLWLLWQRRKECIQSDL